MGGQIKYRLELGTMTLTCLPSRSSGNFEYVFCRLLKKNASLDSKRHLSFWPGEYHKSPVWHKRLKWPLTSQCKGLWILFKGIVFVTSTASSMTSVTSELRYVASLWQMNEPETVLDPLFPQDTQVPLRTHLKLRNIGLLKNPWCYLIFYIFAKLYFSYFFKHSICYIGSADMLFPHAGGSAYVGYRLPL